MRLQEYTGYNRSHGMGKKDYRYAGPPGMNLLQDCFLILQQPQVSVPVGNMAQERRAGTVPPQVRGDHRISGGLKEFRERLVPVLVFFHSVDELYDCLRRFRFIEPQGKRISVSGQQGHILEAHSFSPRFLIPGHPYIYTFSCE